MSKSVKQSLIQELKDLYNNGCFNIMHNEEDYDPSKLSRYSMEKLEDLLDEYNYAYNGLSTFNELQDEDGWEHVWED